MQALMAETGSLVKYPGLEKKPAGITRLSTCQGPRDQPVPRRLRSQAAGRNALMILLYYEQQSEAYGNMVIGSAGMDTH